MYRNIVLLALVALRLAAAPASRAQNDSTFGLSQADFALLSEANTATAAARSLQFEFTASLTLSGVPGSSGTLSLDGSGTLLTGANPSLQLALNGRGGFGSLTTFSGEFRLVDNILYANVTDLSTGRPTGWISESLDNLGSALSQASGGALDTAALSALDASQIGMLITAMQPEQFVSMSRDADEPVNGADAAHFLINLDFNDFFATPFVTILIQRAAGSQNAPTGQELAAAFDGSTLSVEQWVGLDDHLIHRTRVGLVLNLNPSALGQSGGQRTLAFDVDVTLDGFNQSYTVEVPEGAVALSPTTIPQPTASAQTQTGQQIISANTPTVIQIGGAPVELLYTASGAETVTISARSVVPNGVDTTLEVLGPDGRPLAFNDDHDMAFTGANLGNFDAALPDLALPGPGVYTIRVASYSPGGSGGVEVLVTSSAAPAVVAQPTAAPIQEELMVSLIPGALLANGAYTYPVTATRGQTVTIIVTDGTGPLDPRVALLDSQFNTLAANDDHETDVPGLDARDSMILDYVFQADGTYQILVTDAAGTAGPFELVVVRGGGIPDLAEVRAGAVMPTPAGGVEPTAVTDPNAVTIGQSVTIQLDGSSPAVRTLAGAGGQRVTITARAVSPASPDMDVQVTVYGPSGSQLAYNDDHASGDTSLGLRDARVQSLTLPVDGTYRIEVNSWFGVAGEVELRIDPA